jgi:hypothetical protein
MLPAARDGVISIRRRQVGCEKREAVILQESDG